MIEIPLKNDKGRLSLYVVIFLILLLGSLKFSFQQANILSFDFFGLYLYLPATFIYNDPAISDLSWLEQINATYQNTPMFYQLQPEGDYNIIRFFCGIAMLLSPFFFLGHVLALVTAYPADGFSYPYQLAMMLAAFVYVAVGLIFTRNILLRFFSDKVTALTLIALYLGTNLFFWTTFDAGAPHTILFTLYALLIWFTILWHENPKKRFAIAIGVSLGMLIVSRPGEIVAVFIPLFWNVFSWEDVKKKLSLVVKNYPHVLLLILFTVIAGLPQIAYYKHFTGQLYFSTYTDPQSGLDFYAPKFLWVLFSYRKGWLVYAPLMAFAIAGFLPMLTQRNKATLPLMLHFLINLLFIASFTSLISFGWRAFIQSYALMVIPLGFAVQYIVDRHSKIIKGLALLLLSAFIALSILQAWQIMQGIIDGSRMTKAYYWSVFGVTKKEDTNEKLLLIDRNMDDYNNHQLPEGVKYTSRLLQKNDFETPMQYHEKFMVPDPLDSSNTVYRVDPSIAYSPGVKKANGEISQAEHYWASVSFRFLAENPIPDGDFNLVATYNYQGRKKSMQGKVYKYRYIPIKVEKTGEWQQVTIHYLAPEATTPFDRLETYTYYKGKDHIFVDDFEVNILEPVAD